jgi:hypothetical protein
MAQELANCAKRTVGYNTRSFRIKEPIPEREPDPVLQR